MKIRKSETYQYIRNIKCVSICSYKKEVFYNGGSKTLDQFIQRRGGCPIAGNIQGQVGCGSDKTDLAECPCSLQGVGKGDL